MATFKERLEEALRTRSMKARDLSNLTGITEGTISEYRKGKYKASQVNLYKMAKALSVDPGWLMGVSNDPHIRIDLSRITNIMPAPAMRAVPRIGTVACGDPILAEENIEGTDVIPDTIECDFTLRCKGDSMIGARIHDGDIVCIKEQPIVENGEIAAVLIDDVETEATLKRFRKSGDTIFLLPENPDYEPMIFSGRDMEKIRILGKAVYFISKVG